MATAGTITVRIEPKVDRTLGYLESLIFRMDRKRRMSVSIPDSLAKWADEQAVEQGIPVSTVVTTALSQLRRARQSEALLAAILEDFGTDGVQR